MRTEEIPREVLEVMNGPGLRATLGKEGREDDSLDGSCREKYAVCRSDCCDRGEARVKSVEKKAESKGTATLGEAPASPSVAYRQAIDSPVYRLSELMFGSLLASYVVGFIGLLAAKSVGSNPHGLWGIFLPAIQYTSVSLTFAYSTASFYLSYHAGILTMHHVPLERLRFDFLWALAQALAFGFSMLVPEAFPVFVAFLLIAGIYRQGIEHKGLAESFFDRQHGFRYSDRNRPNRKELFREFRSKFLNLLKRKEYEELSGWKPGGRLLRISATLFLIIGVVGVYFLDMQWLPMGLWLPERFRLPENWLLKEGAIAVESFTVLVLVFIRANGILKKRAAFLYSRTQPGTEAGATKNDGTKAERLKMDKIFDEFVEALNALKKER